MTFCMSYYLWNEQYFFPSDRNISHGLFTTISAFTRLHSPFTIFNSNGSYWIQKLRSNYLKFQIATSVNQNCELSLANVLQLYSRVQYLSSIHLWLTALTYRVSPKKVTFWIACLTGQILFFFWYSRALDEKNNDLTRSWPVKQAIQKVIFLGHLVCCSSISPLFLYNRPSFSEFAPKVQRLTSLCAEDNYLRITTRRFWTTELTNRTSGATEAEVRKINYLDQERTKTKEEGKKQQQKQAN